MRETPLPNLSSGSNSVYVKLLEKRLRMLNYKVPQPNNSFDYRTSDNIIAFNKVQGRSRVGYVTESTWRALASPKIPKPRFSWPKYHIEVDQTRQVLMMVKDGKVTAVLHTSTGAGGATRDGTFLVEGGRIRLVHTPVWYVALYEPMLRMLDEMIPVHGATGYVLNSWSSGRRIFRVQMHAPGVCASQ